MFTDTLLTLTTTPNQENVVSALDNAQLFPIVHLFVIVWTWGIPQRFKLSIHLLYHIWFLSLLFKCTDLVRVFKSDRFYLTLGYYVIFVTTIFTRSIVWNTGLTKVTPYHFSHFHQPNTKTRSFYSRGLEQ